MEVAMLLRAALGELGFSCDAAVNEFSPEKTNILLGYHLLAGHEALQGLRYIPYQLEQLTAEEGLYSDRLEKILANAAEVWDYSRENIQFLSQRGIVAKHLPVGYHPMLERIPKTSSNEKDIDILFYGSLSTRRKQVLESLIQAGKLTKVLFGVYGEERDALISRSKIVLNVHHYSSKVFEAVRISYLLNNCVFVVSERSPFYPYPRVELPLVAYEELVPTCLYYLSHPELRQEAVRRIHESFRQNYPMTELLRQAV